MITVSHEEEKIATDPLGEIKKIKQVIESKGSKISKSAKNELKSAGCVFSQNHNAYIFPIEKESEIEAILQAHGIEASIQSTFGYLPETATGKKILGLDTRLSLLENNLQKEQDEFLVRLHKVNGELEKIGCSSIFEEDLKIRPDTKDYPDEFYRHVLDLHHDKNRLLDIGEEIKTVKSNIENLIKNGSDTIEAVKYLCENEVGDARLFQLHFKEKYTFDPSEGKTGEWYLLKDGYWERDINRVRYLDFNKIADFYQSASDDMEDEELKDALAKRASSLRTDRRRRAVLETASAYLMFKGTWDNKIGFLPCKNGLLDLKTGEFLPLNSKDYLRKKADVKFDPKETCPLFSQFMEQITLGDTNLSDFIQRVVGYAVTGEGKEEIIVLLHGEAGRNGKGTLMFVLEKILGRFLHTFGVEMLLAQRNTQSSSSASPDLAGLQGCRLAIFSEIAKKRKLDASKVKNLSGRDTISTRRLFSNIDLQIRPTHTMFIQTNHMPEAPSDDEALWERCVVVPFNARFVRDPNKDKPNERIGNPNIKEELVKEATGILNWILDGARSYYENGLQIPESVKLKTKSYREENDHIGFVIKEHFELLPELSMPAKKLYEMIQSYLKDDKKEPPSHREIGEYLEKNGFTKHRTKNGLVWKGIGVFREGKNEEV